MKYKKKKNKISSKKLNLKGLIGNRSKDFKLWTKFFLCNLLSLGSQFVKLLLPFIHHLCLLFPLLLKILQVYITYSVSIVYKKVLQYIYIIV